MAHYVMIKSHRSLFQRNLSRHSSKSRWKLYQDSFGEGKKFMFNMSAKLQKRWQSDDILDEVIGELHTILSPVRPQRFVVILPTFFLRWTRILWLTLWMLRLNAEAVDRRRIWLLFDQTSLTVLHQQQRIHQENRERLQQTGRRRRAGSQIWVTRLPSGLERLVYLPLTAAPQIAWSIDV